MNLTAVLTDPVERRRFFRFSIVGTLGAVVDFGVFNMLTKMVSLNPVLASVISFTAAIISNFIWNRYWTYPESRSKSIANQMGAFTLVNVIGVGIRTPIFALLDHPLTDLFQDVTMPSTLSKVSPQFMGHNSALAVAVVTVMFWNFFANRYWTFNDVD